MRRFGLLVLAATLVALAGCSRAVTVSSAQPAAAVAAGSLSLTLNPWMSSGESGTAVFVPISSTVTQVQATLTGTPGPHQGFLHVGSCRNMGAIVARLGALNVMANRTGSLTENVNVPLSVLRDGDHFIAFHQANGTPGNAVACTDIPAR